jgi:hypothetical protein
VTFRLVALCLNHYTTGLGNVTQPGHGMCCGVRSFEAPIDSGHGIQVEDQAHVREV